MSWRECSRNSRADPTRCACDQRERTKIRFGHGAALYAGRDARARGWIKSTTLRRAMPRDVGRARRERGPAKIEAQWCASRGLIGLRRAAAGVPARRAGLARTRRTAPQQVVPPHIVMIAEPGVFRVQAHGNRRARRSPGEASPATLLHSSATHAALHGHLGIGGSDAARCRERHGAQRRDLHRAARRAGVHHLAVSDVDRDVAHGAVEEHQVAGLQVALCDG